MLKKLELYAETSGYKQNDLKRKNYINKVEKMCGFTVKHFKYIRMKGENVICSYKK